VNGCDREASTMRRPWKLDLLSHGGKTPLVDHVDAAVLRKFGDIRVLPKRSLLRNLQRILLLDLQVFVWFMF